MRRAAICHPMLFEMMAWKPGFSISTTYLEAMAVGAFALEYGAKSHYVDSYNNLKRLYRILKLLIYIPAPFTTG